ncbi:hypothetical protein MRX96_038429 [Rhipicephalus microplus]
MQCGQDRCPYPYSTVLEPNKKARKAVQKKHDEDLLAECGGEERILPKAEFDAVQNRLHKIQEELVLRKKSSDVDICESCKTMQKKLEELEALNRDLQKSLQQKIFSAGNLYLGSSRVEHGNSQDEFGDANELGGSQRERDHSQDQTVIGSSRDDGKVQWNPEYWWPVLRSQFSVTN